MSLVVLDIKNDEKGKYLLNFLKQLDFLEIKEGFEIPFTPADADKETFEDVLLGSPVLSEEEIKTIENIGKEFNNSKLEEF